jgi:tripartite-type tricarboxylate transporter receptor subunit TctC
MALQNIVEEVPMIVRLALGLSALLLSALPGQAQSVADFYRGKTIQLLIGFTSGGNYDLSARTLARHMGRHIPGNPAIVPQNSPGAGSLRLANLLYNVAPKDGTTIGMVGRGISMEPLLGTDAAKFDSRRYTWIGSVSNETSVCVAWRTSKIKNWNDMLSMPFTVGGQGPGSDDDMFTNMLRNLFKVKARLVAGYPGGNQINLAMERGEIDARCGWSWGAVKTTRYSWVTNKDINLLLQISLQKATDLPDVPLLMDQAMSDRTRQILQAILSRQQMAWPFTAPPGVPKDRADALRAAFDATMRDPEYLAEAKKRGLEVHPMSGTEIDKLIEGLYATPPDVVAAAKAAMTEAGK